MIRAFAVDQFPLRIKPLAAKTVKPLVLTEVDIAFVIDFLQDLLHHRHVVGVGGANELVVADAELRPHFLEQAADMIHIGFRGHIVVFGGLDDFVAMFVRTGQKKGFTPLHFMEATGDIRDDRRVGMSQMRFGIDVINGRGDVESFSHWIYFSP